MEIINIDNWNRKQHFEHFNAMNDPFLGVTVSMDVPIRVNHTLIDGYDLGLLVEKFQYYLNK